MIWIKFWSLIWYLEHGRHRFTKALRGPLARTLFFQLNLQTDMMRRNIEGSQLLPSGSLRRSTPPMLQVSKHILMLCFHWTFQKKGRVMGDQGEALAVASSFGYCASHNNPYQSGEPPH